MNVYITARGEVDTTIQDTGCSRLNTKIHEQGSKLATLGAWTEVQRQVEIELWRVA